MHLHPEHPSTDCEGVVEDDSDTTSRGERMFDRKEFEDVS